MVKSRQLQLTGWRIMENSDKDVNAVATVNFPFATNMYLWQPRYRQLMKHLRNDQQAAYQEKDTRVTASGPKTRA